MGNLYKKFIRIYLLIFAVIIIICVPFYLIMFNALSNSYEKSLNKTIDNGLNFLENDYVNFISNSISNSLDIDISTLKLLDNDLEPPDYFLMDAVYDKYKNSMQESLFNRQSGMIFANGIIITTYKIYPHAKEFYQDFLLMESDTEFQEWKRSIVTDGTPIMITAYDITTDLNGLLYTYSRSASQKYQTIFFSFVNLSDIIESLIPSEIANEINLAIYSSDGDYITGYNNNEIDSLFIFEKHIESMGLRFNIEMPKQYIFRQMRPLYITFIIILLTYIATGIIISIKMAKSNIKPIIHLAEMAKAVQGSMKLYGGDIALGDNIGYLRNFIVNTNTILEQTQIIINQQKDLLISNLFERMIRGLVYTKKPYLDFPEYFTNFPSSFYIGTVLIDGLKGNSFEEHAYKQSEILHIINNLQFKIPYIHFTSNYLVLLLDKHLVEQKKLLAISMVLHDQLRIKAPLMISEKFFKLEALSLAFSQTRLMSRTYRSDNNERIVFYKDSSIHNSGDRVNSLDFDYLYQLIIHHNKDKAIMKIDEIVHKMTSQSKSDDDIAQTFYFVRASISLAAEILPTDLSSDVIIPQYDTSIPIIELFNILKNTADKICKLHELNEFNISQEFNDKVIDYIDNNLYNTELYTKVIIEEFNINENTLQKIVRSKTDKSFFDYIESKRMEKAERMLTYSIVPINIIVQECGYVSHNAFYKAFKRTHKVSPTIYRDNIINQNNSAY